MKAVLCTITGAALLFLSHAGPLAQTPLGNAFTYQGRLEQSGGPVTASADFEFSLWDALTAGSMVGSILPVDSVMVEDGLFTVRLDFGIAVFDGDARWLEINVRSPAGGGSFSTLTPRQPLTASPYSLQTRGIFVDDSLNVGIGTTTPDANLHVADQIKISGGAPGVGKVLTSDASGLGSWEAISGAVPSGAIMFFNQSTCPLGWTELLVARGRYLMGLPTNGELLAVVGDTLSNKEDRPTGQHRHYGSYYRNNVSGGVIPGTGTISEQPLLATIPRYQQEGTVIETAGTNAPYLQCLVCVKD